MFQGHFWAASNRKGMGHIHVLHATPQTRLYRLRIPPVQPHNHRPTQTRKHRPSIPPHLFPKLSSHPDSPFAPPLYRQLRQRKHHPRKDIDDDLLIDTALYTSAKYQIAACETGDEGVSTVFFAVRGGTAEE